MTKEEIQNKNFMCFRLSSKMSDAAIYACLLGVPHKAFIDAASEAYGDCAKYLDYDPEGELECLAVPDGRNTPKPDDPANQGPAEVIRPKVDEDV